MYSAGTALCSLVSMACWSCPLSLAVGRMLSQAPEPLVHTMLHVLDHEVAALGACSSLCPGLDKTLALTTTQVQKETQTVCGMV